MPRTASSLSPRWIEQVETTTSAPSTSPHFPVSISGQTLSPSGCSPVHVATS